MSKLEKISLKKICYFFLLLYLIAISCYQLGTGFDAVFVRITFVLFVLSSLICGKKIKINGLLLWGILFWGFYFLSMVWAKNPNDTMYYLNNAIQTIGIFLCIPLIINNKEDIDSIFKLIIISLVYTSIVLIIRTPQNVWGTDFIGEVIGLNRNTVGLRLSIGFIICIYLIGSYLKNKKGEKLKIFMLFIIAILFASISLLTGSKKALIVLILGFVSYEIINSKGLKLFFKVLLVSIILFLIIYLTFNIPVLYDAIGSRLEHLYLTITGTAKRGQIDGSLLERQFYINQAKILFKRNPIIGYGGNNFVQHLREVGYFKHIAYSHNNIWELLCTLGIVGFTIYYYMWIKLLLTLIKNYKMQKQEKTLLFTIIISILLFLDYGNVSYISDFNMILIAIIYLYISFINKNQTKDGEDE